MRLTDTQKDLLYTAIYNKVNDLRQMPNFSLADIIALVSNDLDFNIDIRNVAPILPQIRISHGAIKRINNSSPALYVVYTESFIYDSMKKERNILRFVNAVEGAGDILYDFNTHTIVESGEGIYISALPCKIRYILQKENLPEWIFNYTEELNDVYHILEDLPEEVYKECPNGFVKFLQETGTPFSKGALYKYYLQNKYGFVEYNLLQGLKNGGRWSSEYTAENLFKFLYDNNLVKPFIKCLTNSAKAGEFVEPTEGFSLAEGIKKMYEVTKELNILDITKTVSANNHIIANSLENLKTQALSLQLQKLNFINGHSNDKFVIVVPQNQTDKKAEGEMQYNCVGYYYDDSIVRGENYIFFLRKKESPNKSYITCRFNKAANEVVEYRAKSNNTVRDTDALQFLHEVESIIQQNADKLA